jgi:hypothetical protein
VASKGLCQLVCILYGNGDKDREAHVTARNHACMNYRGRSDRISNNVEPSSVPDAMQ